MWDWCRKAKEIGGHAWQWTKTAARKTAEAASIGIKGVWELFQTGAARGHALVEAIVQGLNIIPPKWITYGIISLHGTMSLARLTLKNSQNRIKRGIYWVAKTTQDLTQYIPLLVLMGVGLELDPTIFSLLFAGGVSLSLAHGTMKIIRDKLVHCDRALSRAEQATVFTYDNIIHPGTSVLARMGQGALAKEIVEAFVAQMLDDEKDAKSDWLKLFLILPASLEALRLILRRTNPDSKLVNLYSACVVGSGKTFETLAYNVSFITQTTAQAQGTAHERVATVTFQQAVKIFGFSAGSALINGLVSGFHHYNTISKTQEENIKHTPPRIVEIDPESGEELVELMTEPGSSTESKVDRNSSLTSVTQVSMFAPERGSQPKKSPSSPHHELTQPLLLEEEKETHHSSPA